MGGDRDIVSSSSDMGNRWGNYPLNNGYESKRNKSHKSERNKSDEDNGSYENVSLSSFMIGPDVKKGMIGGALATFFSVLAHTANQSDVCIVDTAPFFERCPGSSDGVLSNLMHYHTHRLSIPISGIIALSLAALAGASIFYGVSNLMKRKVTMVQSDTSISFGRSPNTKNPNKPNPNKPNPNTQNLNKSNPKNPSPSSSSTNASIPLPPSRGSSPSGSGTETKVETSSSKESSQESSNSSVSS